eukprot:364655-Chlamydomonas_euryale.AAC.3
MAKPGQGSRWVWLWGMGKPGEGSRWVNLWGMGKQSAGPLRFELLPQVVDTLAEVDFDAAVVNQHIVHLEVRLCDAAAVVRMGL